MIPLNALLPALLAAAILWLHPRPDSLTAADELFRKGEFKQAADLYREVVAANPQSDRAHAGLVRSLLKNDDVDAAREASDSACAAVPGNAAVLAASGDVLTRRGALADAKQVYQQALKSDPGNARALRGLARLHFSDFNRKTALELAAKAYKADPEDPEVIGAHLGNHLPATVAIQLLEKYLQVAANALPEERADAANRLAFLKQMGDRRTWQLVGEPRSAIIPLDRVAQRAGVYTGYRIKAAINGGKPIRLLLDTGATGLIIHRKTAAKHGVEVISPASIRGIGDRGDRSASLGLAKSVQLGPIEFSDCVVTCTDDFRMADADGILGSSTFSQFLITLDLPGRRIDLKPLPAIGGKRHDDPEKWSELDRPFVGELAHFSRLQIWGHLVLETILNDKHRGWFFLDTGAAGNLISTELARQITVLRSVGKAVRGVSGPMETYSTGNIRLLVGNVAQENESMLAVSLKSMSRMLGLELGGLLGYPMLSQLRITIDYRDGLIDLR